MSKVSGEVFNFNVFKRILKRLQPYKKLLSWSVLLTILLAAISPVNPMLVGYTLDNYIMKGNYNGLLQMCSIMLIALFLQTLFQYSQTMVTNLLGQSTVRDLRIQTFNHISKLRLKFFDKTPIGQLITRTVSDMETIADIFAEGLVAMIGDLLQIVVIIGIMFWMDWQLSIAVLIPMPILLLATKIFQKAIKDVFQKVRTEVSNLNTFLQEHISGIAVIQYFAREEQEFKKFRNINARYRNANIRSNWYYSIFFPVVDIISGMSLGLLIWYGAKSVLNNPQLEPGIITTFIMFINMLYRPIRQMADKFNTLQMGMVGAERIFKVLDNSEIIPNNGTLKPIKLEGNISFSEVWFSYDQDLEQYPKYVLKNISFNVESGQTVALVGATGAGKSSTINILTRFYEIQKGSIQIDGIDIKDYDLDYLRLKIATVQQDVFLFADTIFNNITLNSPAISMEQVVDAAKKVGAHDFIVRLPGAYQYNVMERGATLSAGQAQLISFIRALVHQPSVLILDEATSSVDTETELLLQNAIETLMKNQTSIVIAHRLSTIQKADLILVLDKGEIIERGSHQELLKLNGNYKRLYDLQFNSAGIINN